MSNNYHCVFGHKNHCIPLQGFGLTCVKFDIPVTIEVEIETSGDTGESSAFHFVSPLFQCITLLYAQTDLLSSMLDQLNSSQFYGVLADFTWLCEGWFTILGKASNH